MHRTYSESTHISWHSRLVFTIGEVHLGIAVALMGVPFAHSACAGLEPGPAEHGAAAAQVATTPASATSAGGEQGGGAAFRGGQHEQYVMLPEDVASRPRCEKWGSPGVKWEVSMSTMSPHSTSHCRMRASSSCLGHAVPGVSGPGISIALCLNPKSYDTLLSFSSLNR